MEISVGTFSFLLSGNVHGLELFYWIIRNRSFHDLDNVVDKIPKICLSFFAINHYYCCWYRQQIPISYLYRNLVVKLSWYFQNVSQQKTLFATYFFSRNFYINKFFYNGFCRNSNGEYLNLNLFCYKNVSRCFVLYVIYLFINKNYIKCYTKNINSDKF